MKSYFLILIFTIICSYSALSQSDTSRQAKNRPEAAHIDSAKQIDLVDILSLMFNKNVAVDSADDQKMHISIVPSAGYSLSTGFGVNLNGNVIFYTAKDKGKTNLSVISASGFIDTKNQRSLITTANIWTKNNDYDLLVNFRWLKYPTNTYGFGGFSSDAKTDPINFNYVKLYTTLLRRVAPDYYIGAGYNIDYHTNIVEDGNLDGSVSDFTKYGRPYTTISSGINLNLLYDKRGNPINPLSGAYANIILRQNFTFLGSDANWQSLIIDLRKYIHVSDHNNNVLAFWTYLWFTYAGKAPYLDLPSTGWDINATSGRGYIIGRFTGKDMLYAEAEYRFAITHSGILGGVLFTNAQSFPEYPGGSFERIIPAAGTGLRIKLNKHSNTNICVDYGIGVDGSHGFFVNLGEAF